MEMVKANQVRMPPRRDDPGPGPATPENVSPSSPRDSPGKGRLTMKVEFKSLQFDEGNLRPPVRRTPHVPRQKARTMLRSMR